MVFRAVCLRFSGPASEECSGSPGSKCACMLSFRTVRVATSAVGPALASSITADRSGGVVGLGRSGDLLGLALSHSGRMSRPEPARPEDVCGSQRRGVLRQQASPAVGPPGVLSVSSKVLRMSCMRGPRCTFARNSPWPSNEQLSLEPSLKVLIRRHLHSKVLAQHEC
jgi:hypothetical protein